MSLARMPIVLGAGVDRATGTAAVSPAVAVDAENLYARDAKLALRPGLAGTGLPGLPWGTDVCCITTARVTGDILVVLFDRTTRQIRIYRIQPQLGLVQPVGADGVWGTLSPLAEWPVVVAAENDGKVFFAHDEPTLPLRLATVYYTPDLDNPTVSGSLTELRADLDGDGVDHPVYFRGVLAYLEYMCGWGWGSEQEGEEDRGDVFRVSQPAEPTRFLPESFALCGARKEPILAAVPTQGVVAIGKPTEAYRLVGTSPADFRIELLDARYGPISSRSAIAIGDIAFWCAQDGPRVVLASTTEPVAQSLELISPLPSELPPRGPDRTCFVVYDRDRYTLEWLWPNLQTAALRTPGFLLSRWNPSEPRWTFTVREQCLSCAGEVVFTDALSQPALDGYVSDVVATDVSIAPDSRFRRVEVTWTNNLALGNETVQLFLRAGGSTWNIALAVPVGGPTQTAAFEGLLPLQDYDVAIRYIRLGTTTPGYEGSDPDLWTAGTAAGAKDSVQTTSAAVTWTGGAFIADNQPVVLAWSSPQAGVPYLLEKNAGSGWVTLASELVANSFSYTVPLAERNTTVDFRVTARRGSIIGPTAGIRSILMDIVVPQPVWVQSVFNPSNGVVTLQWTPVAVTNFTLEWSPDGSTWRSVGTYTTGGPFNFSASSTFADALVSGVAFFRVRGNIAGRVSPWSVAGPVAMVVNIPPATVLTAQIEPDPTQDNARTVGLRVRVTFTPPGGDATRVRLEVDTRQSRTGAFQVFTSQQVNASTGEVVANIFVPWNGDNNIRNVAPLTVAYRLVSLSSTNFTTPGSTTTPLDLSWTTPPSPVTWTLAFTGNQFNAGFVIATSNRSASTAGHTLRWQRSADNGLSWTDFATAEGTFQPWGTPSVSSSVTNLPVPQAYQFRIQSVFGPYTNVSGPVSATWFGPPGYWTPITLSAPSFSVGLAAYTIPSTLSAFRIAVPNGSLPPNATGIRYDFSVGSSSGPWTPVANVTPTSANVPVALATEQGSTPVFVRGVATAPGAPDSAPTIVERTTSPHPVTVTITTPANLLGTISWSTTLSGWAVVYRGSDSTIRFQQQLTGQSNISGSTLTARGAVAGDFLILYSTTNQPLSQLVSLSSF